MHQQPKNVSQPFVKTVSSGLESEGYIQNQRTSPQ